MSLLALPATDAADRGVVEPVFLHQFFERTATRWPGRPAIDVPPGAGRPHRRVLTYAEVEEQANAVAAFLSPLVSGESVIAILLPRATEFLYIAQLAALKAGAAYTCIEPAFPDEQARAILADSEAVAVLTDAAGMAATARLGFDQERVFDTAEVVRQSGHLLAAPATPDWLTPNSLAYLIYTSGTTGRPKGVMIEHASIANLVAYDIEKLALSPEERISQNSSAAYDSSVEETWLAFGAGATLVVMDDDAVRLGPDLVPWLRRERITVLCPPPTLLRTLGCDDPVAALPDLWFVYVGGEVLPRDVADRWSRGRRLENGYGPTECTVTSTHTTIHPGEEITIGRPIKGLTAWILDDSLNEVGEGEPGELCLGGIPLARGYRNRPELTAQKFPIHSKLGRIYRTGDLVHRDAAGNIHYHGRIDSQVKLRGYRIELEAIEARLAELPGVRQAACRVQASGAQQILVAFIVPDDPLTPPAADTLKTALRDVLPAYMVPSRFGSLLELPVTVSGKLDRKALPELGPELGSNDANRKLTAPRDGLEQAIAAAVQSILHLDHAISVDDDFFNDLGGDSLRAAELISRLRLEASTAQATVRDLYETRTVAGLAARIAAQAIDEGKAAAPGVVPPRRNSEAVRKHPLGAGVLQTLWLLVELVVGSEVAYFTAFDAVPKLIGRVGFIPFLIFSPLIFFAALVVYTPFSIGLAASVKKLLIGRYEPIRAPVWGSFYVRNWIVQQTTRIIPWPLIEGTEFQVYALRALGARIGKRVHLHRGVNLFQGGWDLLEVGDDATISQDAALRLVDLEDGQIVVGPVSIGARATIDIRAGVGPHTVIEEDAHLTALSSLAEGGRIPTGEQWDGIPASRKGSAAAAPALGRERSGTTLGPAAHGVVLVVLRLVLGILLALPLELPFIVMALVYRIDAEEALNWLARPSLNAGLALAAVLLVTVPIPFALALEALAMRAMGRVRPGCISRWSLAYVRVALKAQMVMSAGEWLSGTLFWPVWLRLAGMKIGRGSEISTILDVVPELIEIGGDTFFADGIYLGGPRVHRGTVTLAKTRLGYNNFLGNHVVIPAGQQLPDDILIGLCTVADDSKVRRDSSWFGLPPFELPRREVVECDRRYTHNPSTIRYINRVFWELLRFALPAIPMLVFPVWMETLTRAEHRFSPTVEALAIVPLVSLATAAFFAALILAMKWVLLGKVRPGVHPLWSCWCSRWDFLYVAWAVYGYVGLSALEGTPLLHWYLRAMGVRIGKGVVLGGGFAHVVDPDMLRFEDGATVTCQFQAHTFEDRVLKIDYVRIGPGAGVGHNAVLLYGADIGEQTEVAPHSVVMKHERLLPGHRYAGCPTNPEDENFHHAVESLEAVGQEASPLLPVLESLDAASQEASL